MMLSLIAEASLRSFLLMAVFWTILKVLNVRDCRVQSAAWRAALVASLGMPLLMQALVIHVAAPAATSAILQPIVKPDAGPAPLAVAAGTGAGWSWTDIAWWFYLGVAAYLVVRMLVGLALTWQMTRQAKPVEANWTNDLDVRTCAATSVPVTFGSIVLLPENYVDWPDDKLRVVALHERSHVENGDFYVQILTGLNRAVFWLNPAAWWLLLKLTALAENISDDAALEVLADRPNYAEVLLKMSSSLHKTPVGVAMARPATVKSRIERILGSTTLTSRLNWGKRAMLTTVMVPLVAIAALSVVPDANAQMTTAHGLPLSQAQLDSYAGFYKFNGESDRVFTVKHDGDHLVMVPSGESGFLLMPATADRFIAATKVRITITFQSDPGNRVTGFKFEKNGHVVRAWRIEPDEAKRVLATQKKIVAEQSEPHTKIAIDPQLLGGYVGHYGKDIVVTRDGNQLLAKIQDAAPLPISPYGPKTFFFDAMPAQIDFVTDGNGRATQLVLHIKGRTVTAKRSD
jgi:hypothetical protein